MDETVPTQYWCHMCCQLVNPIIEAEIKCPFCRDGFVEEVSSATRDAQEDNNDFGSDSALSLEAPIVVGMTGNSRQRRRTRRLRFDDEDDSETENMQSRFGGDYSQFDLEMESIIQRRRRSSTMILQLLQDIRAEMASGLENPSSDQGQDREVDMDRDRMLLTNPFDWTNISASYDSSNNSNIVGSLGDFTGPGFDLLLQHLSNSDPNLYGTPPAKKEAIEALPTVVVKEASQCSVCLDDLEIGSEAKQMPCKHMFHCRCIIPWLELHSSCPVCRFELPADEFKLELFHDGNSNRASEGQSVVDHQNSNAVVERRNGGRRFTIPWPFMGLFPSSSAGGGN